MVPDNILQAVIGAVVQPGTGQGDIAQRRRAEGKLIPRFARHQITAEIQPGCILARTELRRADIVIFWSVRSVPL